MNSTELKKKIKSTKIKLSKGTATKPEVNLLVKNLEKYCKKDKNSINNYVDFFAFQELKRRLNSSVFAEVGKQYPIGYKKYCISAEFHNTKILIKTMLRIIGPSRQTGEVLASEYYGVRNSDFKLTWELVVHMQFRHNNIFQSLRNPDSTNNGYNPTTHELFAVPILQMFKALEAINDSDWIIAQNGNLIVHYKIAGRCYTIVRRGSSNEILSYFPREICEDIVPIQLVRDENRFVFNRV